MRVLIMSHGHPTFSPGGAERAAYSLFRHLKENSAIESVVFAARVPDHMVGHDAQFGLFRGRESEILLSVPPIEHFTYQTYNYDMLSRQIFDLLQLTKPDIVHMHHFVYFGLEIIPIIRKFGAKIVFTIHEYLSICHNFGQMVKVGGQLCYSSSPLECSRCFADYTPGKFFLREEMTKTMLGDVDFLISPSEFLQRRYIDWGVSSEAIEVVENVLDPDAVRAAICSSSLDLQKSDSYVEQNTLSIGYFGQINPFKGIHVLLEAVRLLPVEVRNRLHVGIHGANLELQSAEFKEQILRAFAAVEDCVHVYGPYDNGSVIDLMANYHRVVVPSTWWENSPVVIQEARLAGTPLIMSRLGGMAEKAKANVDSLFQVGSPMSLAMEIQKILKIDFTMRTPQQSVIEAQSSSVTRHLDIYRTLS